MAEQAHSPAPVKEESPVVVKYATVEERMRAVEQDNVVLRQMLQRSSERAPLVIEQAAPQCEALQIEAEKAKSEAKRERERRLGLEALLKETKDLGTLEVHKRDGTIRKMQAQILHLKGELLTAQVNHKEDEDVITVLRAENIRLHDIITNHGIADDTKSPPDYLSTLNVRVERLKKDVPSVKPFSAVLRSIEPLIKEQRARALSPARMTMPSPPGSSPDPKATSTPQRKSAERGRSPASTRKGYTQAPAMRARSRSAERRINDWKVGDRVVWRGTQGIVKYIGAVHSLGTGSWAGVELATACGDHNGTLSGIKYFTSPPQTAVFCQLNDLQPGRQLDLGKETPPS